jgi:RNA polymerase sigma-70 factor (ECF subfamily)
MVIAARLTGRILIEQARRRAAWKRRLGVRPAPIDEVDVAPEQSEADVVALDEALARLASLDPRRTQVVELRLFDGQSIDDAASVVNLSTATVRRDWMTSEALAVRTIDVGEVSSRCVPQVES